MYYILCKFDFGHSGLFFQEINDDNVVIRMTDLDGNTLDFLSPDHPDYVIYGSSVMDPNPPRPDWAQ